MGLHGVDIASYQGQPADWKAAAGDLQWAAVKITELEPGGYEYTDPDAAADWAWLAASGKCRIAYLFAHPSVSASDSVNLFTETLGRLGLEDGDGVALDFEVTDGCTAAETAAWAGDVLRLLQRELGRTPVLYTFLEFAYAGNCAGLGAWPLWIADPSSPPGRPRVPAPWSTWAIHQYSISGQVDQDITTWETAAGMAAAIGRKPAPAPSAPVPGPLAREDDSMRISLPAGAREMFAPWPDLAEGQAAPYGNVSMVLAGETGASVTVTFWRGDRTAQQVHDLTSGESVAVAPAHKWPGVTAVTLARTDANTGATASAVVSRW